MLVRNEKSPEMMTIEVTNPSINKRTLKELHFERYQSVVISRVIRGDRTIIALNDTVILEGDRLVAVGLKDNLLKLCNDIGHKIEIDFHNSDHVKFRKVTVDSEEVIGKNLKELGLRRAYGVTVTRFERGGFEYNQNPSWRLERGDVLTLVSSEDRLKEVETLFSRNHLSVTNVNILYLCLFC
jgi:putative transport protein